MGRGNIRSPSTEPHAERRPTYDGVQPGSPRRSLTSTVLSTVAWVDQSPISQLVYRSGSK